jgi:hypothetical protein
LIDEYFVLDTGTVARAAFCQILKKAGSLKTATLNGDLNPSTSHVPYVSDIGTMKEIPGSINIWFMEDFSITDEKTHRIDHCAISSEEDVLKKSLLALMYGVAIVGHVGFRKAGKNSPRDFKFVLQAATYLLNAGYKGRFDLMVQREDGSDTIAFELSKHGDRPRFEILYDPEKCQERAFFEKLLEDVNTDGRFFHSMRPRLAPA